MGKIQVVIDSTAYCTKEFAYRNQIEIVPLSVLFEGEVQDEGFPGDFDVFFERLKVSKDFPTTSQPSIESFANVFKRAVDHGMEVITIVISSKLSGTYNSASAAARMVAPEKISVIDSETSASNLRFLAERAKEMAGEGKSRQEIVDAINTEKKRMGIYLTVDTLDYLKKGGRLTSTQALIGSILNIKPIIALVDGALVPVGKVRGKSKAIETMLSEVPKEVKRLSICHILSPEEAEQARDAIRTRFPDAVITIDELGPVVGAHLGPKAMGITYQW